MRTQGHPAGGVRALSSAVLTRSRAALSFVADCTGELPPRARRRSEDEHREHREHRGVRAQQPADEAPGGHDWSSSVPSFVAVPPRSAVRVTTAEGRTEYREEGGDQRTGLAPPGSS